MQYSLEIDIAYLLLKINDFLLNHAVKINILSFFKENHSVFSISFFAIFCTT